MRNYEELTLEQQCKMKIVETSVGNLNREELTEFALDLYFNNLLTQTYIADVKTLALQAVQDLQQKDNVKKSDLP